MSTGGLSRDDLVEVGIRQLFFGEAPPRDLHLMGRTRTGLEEADLAAAFDLPNEVAGPVTRLIIAEA